MSLKKVDRLSLLPEDITSHILSLMPSKYAVRTSILSKRWRYSWMLVKNLDFDDIYPIHGFDFLSKIVDRVLEVCKTLEINSFRLHFSIKSDEKSRVSNWIDKLVTLNVRELDLHVYLFQLPLSLFTCKTLTKLRLDRIIYDYDAWDCPYPVNLPCLKTLDIVVFMNPFVNAFKLISGCPMLESLSLKILWHHDVEDYLFNIPTLKRLKLTLLCSSYINKVVLHVPNLEYIFFGGQLHSVYVMEDVSSLVEAYVSFSEIRSDNLWVDLLKKLSGVKSLAVDQNIPSSILLPHFPNVKHLEINMWWNSALILEFLESCPDLKHVYMVKQELADSRWFEPKSVPACMLTKLTTIKFYICERWECDMPFLKYMLGNAEVLKTVIITWESLCIEEQMQLCAELLKSPRASRCCEIHFHGNFVSTSS